MVFFFNIYSKILGLLVLLICQCGLAESEIFQVVDQQQIVSVDSTAAALWESCKPQLESQRKVIDSSCLSLLDCAQLGSADLIKECYDIKLEYLSLEESSTHKSDSPEVKENYLLRFYERELFQDAQGLPPTNISNQGQLGEWTPVAGSISLYDVQKYSFPINYSSPGLSGGYEIIIFISASICSVPEAWDVSDSGNGLFIYYTTNETSFNNLDYDAMEVTWFEFGYAQAFSKVQTSDIDQILYIVVKPDDCATCVSSDEWSYQLGVSQNSLVFQYDESQLIQAIDTDYDSVLLSSLSASYDNSSKFTLYFFADDESAKHNYLNDSWCAIQNSNNFIQRQVITEQGANSSFKLSGFNESTTYEAVLLQEFTSVAYGGVIYSSFYFTTKDSNACQIISDLDFCTNVAYAVPNSNLFNATGLALAYDQQAKSLYQNFDYALQQIPCDTELDARYSPIITCLDCAESYRNWLCSVTIPRCATSNETGYKYYQAFEGRTDFIKDTIQPNLDYYEILPCLNMCQAIVRDCPPDFNFACPTKNSSIVNSYFWDEGQEYVSCNYMGNNDNSITSFATRLIGPATIYWVLWVVFGVLFAIL